MSIPKFSAHFVSKFQKRLLAWFDEHGRKTLPWQQHKTPYGVWISEIMLQQTQVKTVVPYFERFMRQFPTLLTLAHADEDAVLYAWTGLGYYSRARNLHRAAKKIMHAYGGEFPSDVAALQSLPGIGQSTAGAIAAIAFNKPETILDGNVKRVLTRFFAIETPIDTRQTEALLWLTAKALTPSTRAADYTQAIMDLGSLVCTRKNPLCKTCALNQSCLAHQKRLAHLLPKKKKKPALPTKDITFVVCQDGEHFLLEKRLQKGVWHKLFSFPELDGKPHQAKVKQFFRSHFQVNATAMHFLQDFRHTFTHFHLQIFPVLIQISSQSISKLAVVEQIWYNPKQPQQIGIPKPVLKLLKVLI